MMMIVPKPPRIAALRTDHRGYPVPWFVADIDGKPDFRVIAPGKIQEALHGCKCWICGGQVGKFVAFVIGPMCAINRVSAEPPSHRDCAEYAAKACPFLSMPKMKRREDGLPEEAIDPAGVMIKRNPGVTLVWITTKYNVFTDGRGGMLFEVGEPTETQWYAHGRPATREEVEDSIASGMPQLVEAAKQDGPEALATLKEMVLTAQQYLPKEQLIILPGA